MGLFVDLVISVSTVQTLHQKKKWKTNHYISFVPSFPKVLAQLLVQIKKQVIIILKKGEKKSTHSIRDVRLSLGSTYSSVSDHVAQKSKSID